MMEKNGEIRPGQTPPQSSQEKTAEQLDNSVQKRLEQAVKPPVK